MWLKKKKEKETATSLFCRRTNLETVITLWIKDLQWATSDKHNADES